jgi:hypothetical protein
MSQIRPLLTGGVIVALVFLIACGGLSSEQKVAANDAVKALRRTDSASELGQSYREFRSSLIETKAEVDNAVTKLPDGELKDELKTSLNALIDKQKAWEAFQAQISMRMVPGYRDPTHNPTHDAAFFFLGKSEPVENALAESLKKYETYEEKSTGYSFKMKELLSATQKESQLHVERASSLIK